MAVAAAALPLAITAPASAASCASAAGISGGSPGFMDSINGYMNVGYGSSFMTITNTETDVLYCGSGNPQIGERFYVRVTTTDVQGGGNPILVTQSVRLPEGLYPAIDASNPLICFTRKLDGTLDRGTNCPNALGLDSFTGAGWTEPYPYYGSTTYVLGQSQLPAGWALVTAVPVVATRAFYGLGGARSTFAWGGAVVSWSGSPGIDYAYSRAPFYVNDRAPTVGYPSSPVTAIGSTTASVRTEIANYWKAGTAWIQYGTTTGYGSTTPTNAIPGNDPTYAAYSSSFNLSGLSAGRTYHWRAVFRTSIGAMYYGADRTFTTSGSSATVPGSPGKPTGVAGNGQVALTWAAPGSDGGSSIIGYKVERSSGSGWATAIANTGSSTRSATVSGLMNGTSYSFRVSAINTVGTGAASVASDPVAPMLVDSTPPTVTTTAMPTIATSTGLTFTYGATDAGSGVASYSVRWARTPAGGGTQAQWIYPPTATETSSTAYTLTGYTGYRYCFSVAAKDNAGNTSAWSATRCSVVPYDDASLTASTGGWTRGTASGWIAGSSTSGSRNGAWLNRSTSTAVWQAGVIATTCPTCGSVAVYIGNSQVGSISLVSSTTVARALKLLPRFSAMKTGPVKLVVTSSTGKPVKIDALATTAW